jgi:hypothetical protein
VTERGFLHVWRINRLVPAKNANEERKSGKEEGEGEEGRRKSGEWEVTSSFSTRIHRGSMEGLAWGSQPPSLPPDDENFALDPPPGFEKSGDRSGSRQKEEDDRSESCRSHALATCCSGCLVSVWHL